ncbi:MAG: hypothetical protein PVJ03_03820 [Chromatiaceae bacterium]|jgi:hypothetical protein
MLKWLIILLTALLVWQFAVRETRIELGPGVHAPDTPEQQALDSPESFAMNGYRITPLAKFRIRAKVLSREDYRFGREADLSPLDLAFGWGRMSDEAVLRNITISQSGRWYRWRTDDFPIPRREIETHSANMHLIPANDRVEDELDDIDAGQVVELRGLLVRADADDGWRWVSSLTRDDTGARACELVYVEQVRAVF